MIDWAVFAAFVVSYEFLEKEIIMEQREKERQKDSSFFFLGEWLCSVEKILEEEIIDWRLLKRDNLIKGERGRER